MSFLIYPTIKQAPILGMLGMGGGIARARGATVVSYTYTGLALNRSAGNGGGGAADGGTVQSGNAGAQPNVGGTATFTTGIPYTTLRVVYGNMANGSLGNSASGAVLSINGSNVSATGTYGLNGYPSNYIKYYDASNGTLNSIGISAGVGGSHETHIAAIIVDGSKILATGPEY